MCIPSVAVRQRLGKENHTATNRRNIEEMLEEAFSMRTVHYQWRVRVSVYPLIVAW
jgi:hypothetical protein